VQQYFVARISILTMLQKYKLTMTTAGFYAIICDKVRYRLIHSIFVFLAERGKWSFEPEN
jgi:hypothetical protein